MAKFIDNNADAFTSEGKQKAYSQRCKIISKLYDIAERAVDNLHGYTMACTSATDSKEVAEALEAFRVLFSNKDENG